jgi:hypothetical protein
MLLAACQTAGPEPGATTSATVNLVVAAGLSQTTSVEILELAVTQAGPEYNLRRSLDQPQDVAALIAALDVELPLGPAARCIERYRLRFHLADGGAEEFAYSCEDGHVFLGGSQPFWFYQQVIPPERFQQLMMELLGS